MAMLLRQIARSAMFTALAAWAPFTLAQGDILHESEPTIGQLKVQGEHIESLLLVGQDTQSRQTFSQDELTGPVALPVGKYRIGLTLEGAYKCTSRDNEVEIQPGETTDLKIGAPLTQSIRVSRRGKLITLEYALTGIGGELYAFDDRSTPPEFVVRKDNREIAHGKFQFG